MAIIHIRCRCDGGDGGTLCLYIYLWTGEIKVALDRGVKPSEISRKHRMDKVADWEIKKKGKTR